MSNYGVARGGVRGSVGPRQQVSSNSTMVDNSSHGDARYNSGYMENAQFNFLEQQRTFLQQTEQLNVLGDALGAGKVLLFKFLSFKSFDLYFSHCFKA
jgi:hypothetical protein